MTSAVSHVETAASHIETAASHVETAASHIIEINLDEFSYPGYEKVILENIEFSIEPGESVAIMGGSGSGKTTLLKICAGIDGYELGVEKVQTNGRFSMLFQQNLLLDYMTVIKNITLPAKFAGLSSLDIKVTEVTESLGIGDLLDMYPFQLSGGEQKRVALARALLYPKINGLIMDEPFSGLDEPRREGILEDLEKWLKESKLTCLFATHSAYEAVHLANRVIIIGGTPSTIIKDDDEVKPSDGVSETWLGSPDAAFFEKVSQIMDLQRSSYFQKGDA